MGQLKGAQRSLTCLLHVHQTAMLVKCLHHKHHMNAARSLVIGMPKGLGLLGSPMCYLMVRAGTLNRLASLIRHTIQSLEAWHKHSCAVLLHLYPGPTGARSDMLPLDQAHSPSPPYPCSDLATEAMQEAACICVTLHAGGMPPSPTPPPTPRLSATAAVHLDPHD